MPISIFIGCPTCGQRAEVTDRFTVSGSPASVEHVKVMCPAGHWSTPLIDHLPLADQQTLASCATPTGPQFLATTASR